MNNKLTWEQKLLVGRILYSYRAHSSAVSNRQAAMRLFGCTPPISPVGVKAQPADNSTDAWSGLSNKQQEQAATEAVLSLKPNWSPEGPRAMKLSKIHAEQILNLFPLETFKDYNNLSQQHKLFIQKANKSFLENSFAASATPAELLTCFKWLYHDQLGSFVERAILAQNLNMSARAALKTNFLTICNQYENIFESYSSITDSTIGIHEITFNKLALIRLSRLFLNIYNADSWKSLSSNKKQVFLKKLIYETRSSGNYNLLKLLLEPLSLTNEYSGDKTTAE